MTFFKKQLANILSKIIIAIAVCLIGILAIPVCIFLLPIMLVWVATEKLLKLLERA